MRKLIVLAVALLALAGFGVPAEGQSNVRLIMNANTVYTYTSVVMTGSSQTLVAAQAGGSTANKGWILMNPTGNDPVYVDISGGTAASTRGIAVAAGTYLSFAGGPTPISLVTIKGTSTNAVQLFTGSP